MMVVDESHPKDQTKRKTTLHDQRESKVSINVFKEEHVSKKEQIFCILQCDLSVTLE